MTERIRVLLVEDNPNDGELVLRELKRSGFDPEYRSVETEADYEACLHPGLDIILSDYAMPQFNGLRALEILRNKGWDVPFILISGSIGEEAAVTALRDGASDYLLKDRMARLGAAVRHALDQCRLRKEKKHAEEALRLFRALIDHSNEAFQVIDPSTGLFLDANPKACSDLGYSRDELLSLGIFDTDPGMAPADWAVFVSKIQEAPFFLLERKNRRKDGSLFPVEVNFTHAKLDRDYIVAAVRDVTDRQHLENQLRQSQKMESIGQLAGGVAHDFNNILTVIQMHSSLILRRDNLPSELAESAREISLAAERAAGLTRQLLAFGRRQILQSRNLDLNVVVDEMARMLERIVGEDIQVNIQPGPSIPAVHADPGMVEQVLLNLAINSRDSMPKGGRIDISTTSVRMETTHTTQHPDARRGNFVRLSVADTGCGIAPENLAKIFDPFFTTKEAGKGTGLGLATVYGIVKQHNGWIEVESTPGLGSVFHVYFPAADGTPSQPQKKNPANQMQGGTETILVVEDEQTIRTIVKLILERYGYRVLTAASGVEALATWGLEKDRIHLVLTDMIMPAGLTGVELGARMSLDNPRVKIIYSSGYATDAIAGRLVLEEGVNFLQKPYAMERLVEVIRTCLDRKDQV